jgi:hypothetical protein
VNKQQWKALLPVLRTIRDAATKISGLQSDIEAIRDQEQEKLDNMPESLQGGEKGEKMTAIIEALTTIVDFDTASLTDAIDEVEGNQ